MTGFSLVLILTVVHAIIDLTIVTPDHASGLQLNWRTFGDEGRTIDGSEASGIRKFDPPSWVARFAKRCASGVRRAVRTLFPRTCRGGFSVSYAISLTLAGAGRKFQRGSPEITPKKQADLSDFLGMKTTQRCIRLRNLVPGKSAIYTILKSIRRLTAILHSWIKLLRRLTRNFQIDRCFYIGKFVAR